MESADQDEQMLRRARVWDRVASLELDALLVTHLPNIFYISGLRATAAAALLFGEEMELLTDFRYLSDAFGLASRNRAHLRVVKVEPSYDETICNRLVQGGFSRVGVESNEMSLRRWRWLSKSLEGQVSFVPTEGLIEEFRMVKGPEEIETLRTAGHLLSRAVAPALELVRAGRSEREIAADIDRAVVEVGFEGRAFETIVASGPNSAFPHARPSTRRLQEGDLVVLDFGGVHNGYCVDLSRSVCVGRRTPSAVRLHQAVIDAQKAAIEIVRPGILASDVDEAARRLLELKGLGEAFGHSTGHGLGIEVHEGPRISRASLTRTKDSPDLLVFTVEPGVYIEGVGGVRIEDDLLVTSQGYEVLTEAPRELVVC